MKLAKVCIVNNLLTLDFMFQINQALLRWLIVDQWFTNKDLLGGGTLSALYVSILSLGN